MRLAQMSFDKNDIEDPAMRAKVDQVRYCTFNFVKIVHFLFSSVGMPNLTLPNIF